MERTYITIFEDNLENLAVAVLSKSGAKLKHIVKEGYPLAKKISKSDWVIILAGTNDMGIYEPSQLTVNKRMNDLLSWDIEANNLVVDIPFRYDQPSVKNIYFMNLKIKKMIQNYRRPLK